MQREVTYHAAYDLSIQKCSMTIDESVKHRINQCWLQIELEVEGTDKQGAFIGYVWVRPEEGGRPQNLSELLLEQGTVVALVAAALGSCVQVCRRCTSRQRSRHTTISCSLLRRAPRMPSELLLEKPDTC